jgi:hypothetical protein
MRNKTTLLLLGGLILAAALGVFWQTLGGFNRFSTPNLKDLFSNNSDINPEDKTDQLCVDPLCLEGWGTDIGSFLRFKSAGEAEYWATVLGDKGVLNGNIVLDLRGYNLTFEQRRQAVDILFSDRDWF